MKSERWRVTEAIRVNSYQAAYQDSFGYTLISADQATILDVARRIVLPVLGVLATGVLAVVSLKLAFKSASNQRLATWLFLVLPVIILFVALVTNPESLRLHALPGVAAVRWELIKQIPLNLIVYYLIEVLIWYWGRPAIEAVQLGVPCVPLLRVGQLVMLSVFVVVVISEVAKFQAFKTSDYEICPNPEGVSVSKDEAFLLLTQSGNTFICSRANLTKGWIYEEFSYLMLPPGKAEMFRTTIFSPLCLKVSPKNTPGAVQSGENVPSCPEQVHAAPLP